MKIALTLFLATWLCIPAFAAQKDLGKMLPLEKLTNAPSARHLSGAGTVDDPAIYHKQPKPLHGNFKTMKYHNEFCDHYDCKTCTKIFKTKAAAEKSGYVPCGKCGG